MDSYKIQRWKRNFNEFIDHPLTLIFGILFLYLSLEVLYAFIVDSPEYGEVEIRYFDSLYRMGAKIDPDIELEWKNLILRVSYKNPRPYLSSYFSRINRREQPHGFIPTNVERNPSEIRTSFRMFERKIDGLDNEMEMLSNCSSTRFNEYTRSHAKSLLKWWPDELHQPTVMVKLNSRERFHQRHPEKRKSGMLRHEKSKQILSIYWCNEIHSFVAIDEKSIPKRVYMWSKKLIQLDKI